MKNIGHRARSKARNSECSRAHLPGYVIFVRITGYAVHYVGISLSGSLASLYYGHGDR